MLNESLGYLLWYYRVAMNRKRNNPKWVVSISDKDVRDVIVVSDVVRKIFE